MSGVLQADLDGQGKKPSGEEKLIENSYTITINDDGGKNDKSENS